MTPTCYCTAPATSGYLCTPHAVHLRQNIKRTPEVLRELDVTITCQARQGGNAGTGERQVFNETASLRADDLRHVLRSAANVAWPLDRYRFDEPDARIAARALGKLSRLLLVPEVHTIAQDLRDYLAAAEAVMEPARERFTYGACECGAQVSAPREASTATCRVCGARWDVSAWRDAKYAAALEVVSTSLGTARQVVAWLALLGHRVPANTVKSWVQRGKLVPAAEGSGAPLFRVADVAALAGLDLDKSRVAP